MQNDPLLCCNLQSEICNHGEELVDWFNQVDATYRGDLKDLNELNFSRFDAKLEQRTAELVALIDRRHGELDAKIDRGYAVLEARIGELDARVNRRCDELDAKIDQRVVELRAEIRGVNERLGAQLAGVRAELIKWMFVIVVGTGLAAVVAVSQLVG